MPENLKVSVLTAEGQLFDAAADFVVVPASEGELGILPRHVPLVATLKPGPVQVTTGDDQEVLFVSGGFVTVSHKGGEEETFVTVLADTGERAHDIDEARAAEARKRAEEMLAQTTSSEEYAEAAGLLERSTQRVRVAELAKRRRSSRERPLRD